MLDSGTSNSFKSIGEFLFPVLGQPSYHYYIQLGVIATHNKSN